MVLAGPAADDGGDTNNFIINTTGVKKTVQSIKEIVRNHSDSEIYAMLKETNMDPNETVQKLLNQDPFHEVKRKRDKKKEPQQTGFKGPVDNGNPIGQDLQRAKPPPSWDRNARRGGYSRAPAPGISREFRIVRDNRVISSNAKPETSQPQASGSQQAQPSVPEKNSSGNLNKQKHSAAIKPKVYMASRGVSEPRDSGPPVTKDLGQNASHSPLSSEESQKTASASNLELQREVKSNSYAPAAPTSISSVIGVYSSSSDPVHVPSPDSRTAGTVGAIRREVGVVGVRRPPSDRSTTHSFVSNNTYPVSSVRKDMSLPAESFGHTASISKSNQPNQTSSSNSNMPSISINRSLSNSQYGSKLHQQTVGHQKAGPSSMEWKPKPSQKTTVISSAVVGTTSALSSSCADNCISSNTVEVTGLAEKLSQANVAENNNVIIPQHFRVPESERTQFKFGSFGACFDSSRGSTSALQATESVELLNDEPSISVSVPVPASSGEDISAADPGDLVDGQARPSQSDSPASSVESDQHPIGNHESLSENIDSYAEIGLVQSHSPPYSSPEPSQLQNPSGLPSYSGYDAHTSYDVPFFRNVMDDNVRGQVLALPSEALSSHATNSGPPSSAAMTQQQSLQQQQQQQAVAQMYPQLQFSHFPNFVPYRHIFSPVYVPPMAIPNYPSNPSYPHPSNGSSYLLMPGGSSHLTAGGMKYTPSQYKPVPTGSPAGYGNFTNPSGFTISAPTSIGAATGLEDVTRIKYKDNNLYVPNAQQAESSDIWIQTPREVPTLQSAPYYNLSGQAAHAAFMPSHAGHGSFNATAMSSHVQYPGLYHPPQPGSIPNSHHLVHQQVAPGFGGGVGVGMAAPGPQVGTYQQPQASHLNWAANF